VDGRAVDEVVGAIDGWLTDPLRRAAAARLGPERAMEWDWERVAERLDRLVDRLAGASGPPGAPVEDDAR
jgi:glycosyltransferase involved in cell wall biosynthesis